LDLFAVISAFFQTAVLAVMLFFAIRLLIKNTDSLTAVFLSFFYGLWFLSDLYWLIYDILRPDVRMPFAANEIGEAGMLLMLAAILNSAVPHGSGAATKQVIGAVIFAISNVVLWIAWSGEWVQDIITGLVFVWLLSSAVCALKVVHALSKKEWILFGTYCAALIAGQGLTFFFADPVKSYIDTGCYVLISLSIMYWLVKMIVSFTKRSSAKKLISLSVTNIVWLSVALYMSAGMYYNIFFYIETVCAIIVYLAARKVVNES